MTEKPDDLGAVRTLVDTLRPFQAEEQERILRWTREKLGLPTQSPGAAPGHGSPSPPGGRGPAEVIPPKNIKTFIAEKNPSSDNQFAAVVAYFYRFVAQGSERKDFITANDLQEACRLIGRTRKLANPGQTLINAHMAGLLDKGADRGTYTISTVGENLVAVSLTPETGASASARGRTSRRSSASRKARRAARRGSGSAKRNPRS